LDYLSIALNLGVSFRLVSTDSEHHQNTNEVVAIEVKSHLEVRDVKRFLQTLERFKIAFPKYQNYKLYGAVAGIKIDERSDVYATQEGLFLIEPAGDSVIITNSEKVKPRIW
jgi:hypothetical protein